MMTRKEVGQYGKKKESQEEGRQKEKETLALPNPAPLWCRVLFLSKINSV